MTEIAFSILSSNFLELGKDIAKVEPYVDALHFDVMDGHFVSDISFGVPILKQISTVLPIDTHLMVTNPEDHISSFAPYSRSIYFHVEATSTPEHIVSLIHKEGCTPGIVISPDTPVSAIALYLSTIHHVLVMSVHPGAGGQKYIPATLEKIREIKRIAPNTHVMVDGGMNAETGQEAIRMGANTLVSGSYISRSTSIPDAIRALRGSKL